MTDYLFTSESVTEGHPDKICDQISDGILDECLRQDPRSRVACEALVKTGMAIIAGEITTTAYVDMPGVVREVIKNIGYRDSSMGFDYQTCAVLTGIEPQSPDIAQGVNQGEGLLEDQGAGDQGLMFGFATSETDVLMPLPITLAHRLTRRLAEVRKNGDVDFLRPDGKSQVTVQYVDDKPSRIEAVVLSTQHHPDVTQEQIRESMIELVIRQVLPAEMLDDQTKIFINPTGRFVLGGPFADCGLTGRKIIVDTYGGMGAHGGGAFSGKDPSKVDRSGSYYARYIAKNLVAAGVATKVEVQLAYAIGVAQPVSVLVKTFGTGKVSDEKIGAYVKENFDARPSMMIKELDLLRPIYLQTAAYGHFGRDEEGFSWESTARAEQIRSDLL
jgi:S-adenosylmethionine synthetase